jgi:hypothetical protein
MFHQIRNHAWLLAAPPSQDAAVSACTGDREKTIKKSESPEILERKLSGFM